MEHDVNPARGSDECLSETFERMGRDVRGVQERELVEQRASLSLAKFQQALEASKAPAPASFARAFGRKPALLLAAATLFSAFIVSFIVRRHPLAFTVGTRAGVVGTLISANDNGPLPVVFSDGTSLLFERGSEARVVGVATHGANVIVEHGHVEARVVHTSKTAWRVDAGPFQVQVTGTRFGVTWEPTDRLFTLSLYEGSVVLRGCDHPAQVVKAGDVVRTKCDLHAEPKSEVVAVPAASVAPAVSAPVESGLPDGGADVVTATQKSGAATSGLHPDASPPVSWQSLMEQGKHHEAFAAVRTDFDRLCSQLPASDLLQLADAARFAGRPAEAKQAWRSIRSRFASNQHAAADAAFFLGRTSLEEGEVKEAAGWFSTSLREDADGTFAREASGRRIEALEKMGDRAAAATEARSYLRNYPEGPHSKLAARLTEGDRY